MLMAAISVSRSRYVHNACAHGFPLLTFNFSWWMTYLTTSLEKKRWENLEGLIYIWVLRQALPCMHGRSIRKWGRSLLASLNSQATLNS